MITTVTLNPCMDYTVTVPGLLVGTLNLADSSRTDMSGKGINVSVALSELGCHAMCTGISFSESHAALTERLKHLGIPHDFTVTPGSVRLNVKVFDSHTREMTELNSRGEPVPARTLEETVRKIEGLAAKSELLVLSGRIPPGAGDDIYRRIIQRVRGSGVKVVVDAEGAPLREAVRERPFLIKPNLYELEKTFGRRAESIPEVLSVCGWLLSSGVEIVAVSMGEKGALIASRDGAYHAGALNVEVKSLQGAGDSMVAGICKAYAEGRRLADMLRSGVAAASASIIREGTQLCQRQDYEELLGRVAVQTLHYS